jgi:ferritin-like metal-binding protein YciE
MKASPCTPSLSRARAKDASSKPANDEFATAVFSELRHLHHCEKVLQRMYPRLKNTPELRDRFLDQLAEMQQRAQRLDAVLNPVDALRYAPPANTFVNAPVA